MNEKLRDTIINDAIVGMYGVEKPIHNDPGERYFTELSKTAGAIAAKHGIGFHRAYSAVEAAIDDGFEIGPENPVL